MTTLLQLDASAQSLERSHTRRLVRGFLDTWRQHRPHDEVITRDLARDLVPPIDTAWIAAAFTPPAARTQAMHERLALSDRLIDEVTAADVIVMGAPMYNYGMPATLKAWVDQVARIRRTFSVELARGDTPIEPLLHGKVLVVLSSRGEFGFAPGGPRAHLNALDPHLAACAHYWGVAPADHHTVVIEYQEFKDHRHDTSVAQAHADVQALADRLAAAR